MYPEKIGCLAGRIGILSMLLLSRQQRKQIRNKTFILKQHDTSRTKRKSRNVFRRRLCFELMQIIFNQNFGQLRESFLDSAVNMCGLTFRPEVRWEWTMLYSLCRSWWGGRSSPSQESTVSGRIQRLHILSHSLCILAVFVLHDEVLLWCALEP